MFSSSQHRAADPGPTGGGPQPGLRALVRRKARLRAGFGGERETPRGRPAGRRAGREASSRPARDGGWLGATRKASLQPGRGQAAPRSPVRCRGGPARPLAPPLPLPAGHTRPLGRQEAPPLPCRGLSSAGTPAPAFRVPPATVALPVATINRPARPPANHRAAEAPSGPERHFRWEMGNSDTARYGGSGRRRGRGVAVTWPSLGSCATCGAACCGSRCACAAACCGGERERGQGGLRRPRAAPA